MSVVDVERLREIAEVEFADIVAEAVVPDANELRVILNEGSFIDVWFSLKLQGRYSFHWERRAIDGKIYRHDNASHRRWQSVATFPHHFHDGSETDVVESHISAIPADALREFLTFVRARLER
ncbi:MAG: toxin-antitoxin system TumE family protein [Terriglobia bacterium]